MPEFYHAQQRALQEEFDTRRLAGRMEESIVSDVLGAGDIDFIQRLDMFFLATVDARGHVNCSYKAGAPGFVRVVDEHTLAFPNYDGNGMYLSMGNIAQTNQVGMLFIDFENQKRMRVNGEATIERADPLLKEYPEAPFIVRVRTREVFPNCPRYIHRMQRVESSHFVPQSGCQTPVPGWKKGDWVADVLPQNDPARDPDREVLDR
jgi:hypothetical protein